jgi:hypothetical protein
MPQGHKSGRKTIMTRLMPLGHNPSTRLMPQGHKVRVYGKHFYSLHYKEKKEKNSCWIFNFGGFGKSVTFFNSLDFFYYLKNEIFLFYLLNLTSKGRASI